MSITCRSLYLSLLKDLEGQLSVDQCLAAYLGGVVPIYPDSEPHNFAAAALLNNILKKDITERSPDADDKALALFLQMNQRCKEWCPLPQSTLDDLLLGEFKQSVHRFFEGYGDWSGADLPDNLCEYVKDGSCGPGRSAASGNTSLYVKLYDQPLEASNLGIAEAYLSVVSGYPRWKSAEFFRQLSHGPEVKVVPSKLTFVPKSNSISRTICAEPTLNMWFQQSVAKRLTTALEQRFGIDLTDQPEVNRHLCRLGSKRGNYATIDLKSASDCLSMGLAAFCLPDRILSLLSTVRSKQALVPSGEAVDLFMVGSMGNACTFPLQTIIYSCVVSAVYSVLDLPLVRTSRSRSATWNGELSFTKSITRHGNFSVFGDDIVVDTRAFRLTCRLLSLLGFIVNETKSFDSGWFRESCGEDYYHGEWVRPVFSKDLRRIQSRMSLFNGLADWAARTRLSVTNTLRWLYRSVPRRSRFLVPKSEDPSSGFQVPFSLIAEWSPDQHYSYKCYVSEPACVALDKSGQLLECKTHRAHVNPDGFIMVALQGGLRHATFGIRISDPVYRVCTRLTLYWDYFVLGSDREDRITMCRRDGDIIRALTSEDHR